MVYEIFDKPTTMAEIIDNTFTCEFCNCKFKVNRNRIETHESYSAVGYYHYDIFKRIKCPICGETVKEKKVGYRRI